MEKKPEIVSGVGRQERTSIFAKAVLWAAGFGAVAFILYIISLA